MPKDKPSRQTKLKLRKGFHNAPISYRVLMISQFSAADKKVIAKGLLKALTPKKAEELIPKQGKSVWRLIANSSVGINGCFDLTVLHYKGSEVAVFWKRQTSNVIPAPEDPVPEGVLENPDDVWVRLDLFSKSPRQLAGVAAEEIASLHNEIASLHLELQAKERLLVANNQTIASLRGKIK